MNTTTTRKYLVVFTCIRTGETSGVVACAQHLHEMRPRRYTNGPDCEIREAESDCVCEACNQTLARD